MLVFNRRVTGSGQITSQGFLTLQSDSALANYQGEVVVYGALTYVSWLKIDNGTNAQIPWLHVESVTSLYTAQVNVLGSLTVSSQLVLKGFIEEFMAMLAQKDKQFGFAYFLDNEFLLFA